MLTLQLVISASLFVYFILLLIFPKSDKEIIGARFSKYFKKETMEDIEEEIRLQRQRKVQKKRMLNKKLISKELESSVLNSGIKLTPSEFLNLWIGAVFLPVILLALLSASILTIIAAFAIGLALPPFMLKKAKKKREDLFTKQLGEALVIIGNAIKGGFSFIQALESVSTDMQPPISIEFAKTLREIDYGITQNVALRHMSDRLQNQDLELLVSAVITSSQVGANLSDILETISSTIKDRIRIKQEIKVLTASGRISALIIGGLPIFLLLILMVINPGYVDMFFSTTIGMVMLAVAFILEIIGFMCITKITDIEY